GFSGRVWGRGRRQTMASGVTGLARDGNPRAHPSCLANGVLPHVVSGCPRQDSNLRARLRRPLLSPLSYGGSRTAARLPAIDGVAGGARTPGGPPGSRSPRLSRRENQPRDANLAPVAQGLGRVLVVDDDEVIRQLIAVNLTLEGFDVATA